MTADPSGSPLPVAAGEPPASSIGAVGLGILAVAAYACALQLIDVRPYAVFQHYQSWSWIFTERPLAVWIVLAQVAVVGWFAWRFRRALWRTVTGSAPTRAWLVVLALAAFSAAVPTEGVSRSLGEVLLAGALAVVAALNLWLAVLMLPAGWLSRAAAAVESRVTLRQGSSVPRPWDRHLPAVVALWVVILSAVASDMVLERVPHIDDSISNFFQAKYLAAGRLYLPAPPDAESFQVDQTVVEHGRWFGYAFPGWPAVLAVGVVAGVPWLVNPVLSGVLILLGHALIRRRAGPAAANIAVLLLAVSPWLIFMSAEFMAHPLTGVLVLLGALAFDHASARASRWGLWAVIAGAAAGALALTRAIDGAILVAALGVTVVLDRRVVRAIPAALLAAVVAAGVAALALPYNRAITGRATYPPHMAWSDGHWGPGVDRLGFGPDVGIRAWTNLDPLPGHGPADVVLNANKNAFMTNIDLFGWAFGSLAFVWLAIGIGPWRRGDALMWALCGAFVLGYSAYWFSGGPDLGARYWYPLLVPLAALTARGIGALAERLEAKAKGSLREVGARVGAFVLAASLSSALVMMPWRAITKHYRYRGIGGDIRALADERHFDHALVFVQAQANKRDFAAAFNFNPRTLDDSATIYALDAGPDHRAAVVAHFSDRPVWVIGRVRPGGPIDVLVGPLPPGSVPR